MTNPYQINDNPVTMPIPPTPAVNSLVGRYITLEPLALADDKVFEQLYEVSHGDKDKESVWEFMPYGPFGGVSEMIKDYRTMAVAGDPIFYIVRHCHNQQAAGVVSFLRINPAAYSIEIGHIWHAINTQRGRANTEASFLQINNAFALGYRRLEWKCNAMNIKSRLAALRLGLAFEGVFRQCVVFKEKNRDTAWFAMIDKDWQSAKQNFEQWLESPLGEFSLAQNNYPLVKWSLPAHDFWVA